MGDYPKGPPKNGETAAFMEKAHLREVENRMKRYRQRNREENRRNMTKPTENALFVVENLFRREMAVLVKHFSLPGRDETDGKESRRG